MKKSLKIFATSKWFDLFGVALVVGIAIASGYLNSRLDKFCRLGTMDYPCPLWIDFRNQRWDFHVVHSFHGEIEQIGQLLWYC